MKNNLPFDPNGQIFHWGPVPGKFLYCSVFTDVHYKFFRAKYQENWSETLWLFQNDRMFWVNEQNDIELAGEKVFLKYLLPINSRENIYKEWQEYNNQLLTLENEIDKTDLTQLSNEELKNLWTKFHEDYINFWVTGSIPELANYGSESYLRKKLGETIKDDANLTEIMEVLTAPTRLSFYQEEEIDLAKTKNIKKHQQKYFWLKNSYAGTEILPTSFFAERKNKVNKNIEKEMKTKIKETVSNKKTIQKQYALTPEIMNIGKAISDGVGWQDERKKYIFMVLHYEDVMLNEVARRFKYTSEELHRAWYFEIENIINGKNLHTKLAKRKTGFGVRFFHSCKELNGEETKNFWNTYETRVEENITETKGMVASKGKATVMQGIVHILLDPTKSDGFKDGEVMVAPMTSPEYIFAMKKASAVITDTGGLTSHAAIVSRELNIPCVVGAKGSTLLFKNGDTVEINTATGVVKLIK
ncbi:MAG TPA: hypothetical protein DEB09_05280 [Candidatus Magasanikbacteria bacterium]|nr:hypothetical protein [Candidatus Magasanikbacteria bacterium]